MGLSIVVRDVRMTESAAKRKKLAFRQLRLRGMVHAIVKVQQGKLGLGGAIRSASPGCRGGAMHQLPIASDQLAIHHKWQIASFRRSSARRAIGWQLTKSFQLWQESTFLYKFSSLA